MEIKKQKMPNFKNPICDLFKIDYPIIQAGMVWCSPWQLASAVSNAGGLGVIGAGSMYPEVLKEHLVKCKAATSKPFAVNLPLLYPDIDKHIDLILEHEVPIVFTSAGNPKTWTSHLKSHGITVVHVVSSLKFALKSQAAGVDAIVAEGFEAGGHNGIDETTTMCLIPSIKKHINLPLIAAGGIADGASMLAAFALGADAVQIGSRFVMSEESSAHINFQKAIQDATEGQTKLTLKELTPVRLLKNQFYDQIQKAYASCATDHELKELLARGRAKKGMFQGDLNEGELEIGQVSAFLDEVLPAKTIFNRIVEQYNETLVSLKALK